MYGLINKMTTTPGQRDALAAILVRGSAGLPGCLSYVVAKDAAEPEALWITEVWADAESHRASLLLPAVRAAIAAGRGMITGMPVRVVTDVVGRDGVAA